MGAPARAARTLPLIPPTGRRQVLSAGESCRHRARRRIAELRGAVLYITGRGEIYTRIGQREIRVYSPEGALQGRVTLKGLDAACEAIRFDTYGNLYMLDGIPDPDGQYSGAMPGMRLVRWERN